ncbi:hypothetical protein CHUAL_008774 [Chamberlinius hualienensis]|uniref:Cytochrome P450 3198A1 n=1 Tax=Chamberlinius hualienensis TaxID=1551368 RepID=A0A1J1E3P9_9MYRI|nr:cytochrome P450 3198A1 [Chamberlinius hualienensis]
MLNEILNSNSLFRDNISIWLLLVVSILVFAIRYNYTRNRPPLPPGPFFTFPVLGHLPLLGKWPHLQMYKLAQRYGPIASLKLGSSFAVVLNDYKIIHQTFKLKGEIFSDRTLNNPFYLTAEKSLAGTNGWQWAEHRKFFDKYLKKTGLGGSNYDEKIMEEVTCFLNQCEQRQKKDDKNGTEGIDFENDLAISVANNTCLLVFGKRFDYNDPHFLNLLKNENELTILYNTSGILYFLPYLTKLLSLFLLAPGLKKLRQLAKEFDKFSESLVKDHLFSTNKFVKDDYIFNFLEEKKRREMEGIEDKVFTYPWLTGILHALYGGGVETAFNVIRFAILAIIRQPDLQKKIHEELDRAIGNRNVTINDRRLTPLTWATLLEILRITTPLPLSIPRSNRKEVVVEGYRIPKGSYIIPNLFYIHHDPKLWKDPFEFRPERFIVNGEVVKCPYLIPFGVGKRSCPGEVLGNAEDFLYFASMMQHYEFQSPIEIQHLPPLVADRPSLVPGCPSYKVIMKRRNL